MPSMFHDSHYVKLIVRRPFRIASPYRHPAPTDTPAHCDPARCELRSHRTQSVGIAPTW